MYEQRINKLENDLMVCSHEYDKLSNLLQKQNVKANERSSPSRDQNLSEVLQQLQVREQELEEQIQESNNYLMEESQQELQILEEKNKYLMQENQRMFLQNQNLSRQIAINSK